MADKPSLCPADIGQWARTPTQQPTDMSHQQRQIDSVLRSKNGPFPPLKPMPKVSK